MSLSPSTLAQHAQQNTSCRRDQRAPAIVPLTCFVPLAAHWEFGTTIGSSALNRHLSPPRVATTTSSSLRNLHASFALPPIADFASAATSPRSHSSPSFCAPDPLRPKRQPQSTTPLVHRGILFPARPRATPPDASEIQKTWLHGRSFAILTLHRRCPTFTTRGATSPLRPPHRPTKRRWRRPGTRDPSQGPRPHA